MPDIVQPAIVTHMYLYTLPNLTNKDKQFLKTSGYCIIQWELLFTGDDDDDDNGDDDDDEDDNYGYSNGGDDDADDGENLIVKHTRVEHEGRFKST